MLSGIFLANCVDCKKTIKDIKNDVKKEIGIRFVCMPSTKSFLLFMAMNLLLVKLHMVWLERIQKKWFNLLLCCICCNKDVLC